jgi:hypothetical protein
MVEIDFKAKRGEVIVIGRKQAMRVGRRRKVGSKKVKMPQVEFDLGAIKEIKKRKKRSQKRR